MASPPSGGGGNAGSKAKGGSHAKGGRNSPSGTKMLVDPKKLAGGKCNSSK